MFFFGYSTGNETYKLSMYSFALLVNATSLEIIINHLQNIYCVFSSRYIDDNVESSLKYLNSRLKGLNKVDDISVQFIESESVEVDECLQEVDSDDDDGDKEKAVYAISQIPFLPYIKKRLESFQKALPVLDADFDDQQVVNKFYKPCYQKILGKKWIGLLPFWSSIMYNTGYYCFSRLLDNTYNL